MKTVGLLIISHSPIIRLEFSLSVIINDFSPNKKSFELSLTFSKITFSSNNRVLDTFVNFAFSFTPDAIINSFLKNIDLVTYEFKGIY